ncbi:MULTISPECIES: nicotinate-nucleotide adenylyltransferase [Chromohalobacter]|uniref:nicotinate-nucleotide adenylyltransferase n=1 Tax=Chromohalobacter TaxID=42054 RepID=UPI0005546159|nr:MULTISPECIES: nicotinate-nucleotide adenylyltransferase [Chromohalobacter]MBZ5877212.1 nicotinate-nucleotide adenylyltransferase [Chromohalobacter salexigens]MDF9433647.1 nicotinate-nucleotide adenylyltransferase [Chromohalobacter israelensis]NQY44498.1 nicotinate-nucleotide adenylyltransferase [Chromohalobacter sp.]
MCAAEARPARVAMLGGTFDPVHMGHLRSAVELREALELDRVHMVPARVPPHRATPGVSAERRAALLALGIGDTPGLAVDDREITRDGPSYSADTLASLREELGPQARLVMALGHDAYLNLAEWHEPQRLFDLAHIVVIDRPDHDRPLAPALQELVAGREVSDVETLMQAPAGSLLALRLPTRMAISATSIRERLRRGDSIRYLVPEAVERDLLARGLYA